MKKYTLLAGSHVVGDRVFNAGDVVASDDDLVKLHKGKFSALPEPEVVYVEVPAPKPAPAPEPVAEAPVEEPVAEEATPKAKKAK